MPTDARWTRAKAQTTVAPRCALIRSPTVWASIYTHVSVHCTISCSAQAIIDDLQCCGGRVGLARATCSAHRFRRKSVLATPCAPQHMNAATHPLDSQWPGARSSQQRSSNMYTQFNTVDNRLAMCGNLVQGSPHLFFTLLSPLAALLH